MKTNTGDLKLMNKKILALIFTIIVSIALVLVPTIARSNIPVVNLSYIKCSQYIDSVVSTGQIEESKKSQVSIDIPLVIKEIKVKTGDYVEQGDVLFTVDVKKTKEVILSSGLLTEYSQLYESFAGFADAYKEELLSKADIKNEYTAETSGTVSQINISNGQTTGASDVLMTIDSSAGMLVKVNINESDIEKIKIGSKANITGSGFKDKVYTATVIFIGKNAKKVIIGTTAEIVVEVTLKIDDPDNNLKSGFSAKAEIITSEPVDIMLVPYEAVCQDDNNQEFVYVYSKGVVLRKDIVTGKEFSEGIQIVSGLNPDDQVITNPIKIKSDKIIVDIE